MFSPKVNLAIPDSGPFFEENNIQLFVRRLDVLDVVYGGNKWFKLKYNVLKAQSLGINHLVTFGGAFSNHIAATARIGSLCGMQTTGIIRGENEYSNNITLKRAVNDGMKLIFCSREMYRKKNDPDFILTLTDFSSRYLLIPEGGSNAEGVLGAKEILSDSDYGYDFITVCCGTGATAAGMILNMNSDQHLIGFSVLNDKGSLESEIEKHLQTFNPIKKIPDWHIEHQYHFGGYGKTTAELMTFIERFEAEKKISIEPVYTGKMFFGLSKMISSGAIPGGSRILAIHTGGLQYLGN